MGDLTKNFSRHEFSCPCCGQAEMDPWFMSMLQLLRDAYGKPIVPVEGGGYRCQMYGPNKTSAHCEGKAIDPGIPREDMYEVLKLAFRLGFTGIGLKQKDGAWQLHLDTALPILNKRPRPWVWTY